MKSHFSSGSRGQKKKKKKGREGGGGRRRWVEKKKRRRIKKKFNGRKRQKRAARLLGERHVEIDKKGEAVVQHKGPLFTVLSEFLNYVQKESTLGESRIKMQMIYICITN